MLAEAGAVGIALEHALVGWGGGALPAWTTMEAVGISQELQAELEPAFSREQARPASAAATLAVKLSLGPSSSISSKSTASS